MDKKLATQRSNASMTALLLLAGLTLPLGFAPTAAARDETGFTCLADPATECSNGVDDACSRSIEHVIGTGPGYVGWAATHPGEFAESVCDIDQVPAC